MEEVMMKVRSSTCEEEEFTNIRLLVVSLEKSKLAKPQLLLSLRKCLKVKICQMV